MIPRPDSAARAAAAPHAGLHLPTSWYVMLMCGLLIATGVAWGSRVGVGRPEPAADAPPPSRAGAEER